MNQQCKVCGEPAAGFHFGAFTCEGCKSFFGRSYNNVSSIQECKNGGQCEINKKNRTACKACRLRKCITVGMSKSGSRYGRRSNWFKIHCLLQEQQQAVAQQQKSMPSSLIGPSGSYTNGHSFPRPTKEELMMYGYEEHYKQSSASPSISSPDSHNSDSSIENEKRNAALRRKLHETKELSFPSFPLLSHPFMPPPGLMPQLFPGYPHPLYPHPQSLLSMRDVAFPQSANNNSRFIQNNNNVDNNTKQIEDYSQRFFLHQLMNKQNSPYSEEKERTLSPHQTEEEQENIDQSQTKLPPSISSSVVLKEEISTITPPRSPCITNNNQDAPIDLSVKVPTENTLIPKRKLATSDRGSPRGSAGSDDDHTSEPRSLNVSEESESDTGNDDDNVSVEYKQKTVKKIKVEGTPLDLTTKA